MARTQIKEDTIKQQGGGIRKYTHSWKEEDMFFLKNIFEFFPAKLTAAQVQVVYISISPEHIVHTLCRNVQ